MPVFISLALFLSAETAPISPVTRDVVKPRMGDQLTQLSFKDALRQTQKAVLQPIDEDTSRLKASCACMCMSLRMSSSMQSCMLCCSRPLLLEVSSSPCWPSPSCGTLQTRRELRVRQRRCGCRARAVPMVKGGEQTNRLFALADHGHLRLPLRAPR